MNHTFQLRARLGRTWILKSDESQSKSDRPFVGYESAPQVSGNQGYMIFKTLSIANIHAFIH